MKKYWGKCIEKLGDYVKREHLCKIDFPPDLDTHS